MYVKIKEKYDNLSMPIKASLWYTICNIFNKGIALLSTPVFTRILTEEQYGTFSIFQSWCGILIIFTSLNIFLGGYQKGLLLYKNDKDRFTSSQLGLTTTITILFFGIYLLNIEFWTKIFELSPFLMGLMFVELLTMPALEFWSSRQRFDYKYKKNVLITLSMTVISLGLGVYTILHTEYKVEARVISDVFAKTLFAGCLFVILMKKGKIFFHKKYWKYALTFNLPLIPHYLSNYVLGQSDRLMIGKMVGNTQAAYYSVAYSISTMMLLITNSINNSLTPYIYKALDSKTEKNIKNITTPLVILVAGLCVLTMAFAPEVILVFAGKKYMDAIYIIPPVAASVYFIFLYSLFSNVEYFYQKTKFIAMATFISAGINLILNYIFIQKYGYYAAGYTTLICYICLAFMHYVFYRKVLKESLGDNHENIYDMKVILFSSIFMLGIMFVMTFTYQFIVIRYTIIGCILIIAFVNRNKLIGNLKKIKRK